MYLIKSLRARRIAAGAVSLTAGLSLAACGSTTQAADQATTTIQTATASDTSAVSTTTVASLADNVASHAESDDADYNAAEAVTITLADGATASTSADGVTVADDVVTISAPGTYVLSGTLTDGRIVVNSEDEGKVRLVLKNASITSSSGPAVVITAADEAVVVLADGTTNTLTDGTGYDTGATDAPNAALFSMADLTIAGDGALTVTGNTNDGITSKDGLVILAGSVTVHARDDALRGKDYVIAEGGTLNLRADGDGIKSDNETDDTVGYVVVNGGSVRISSGDDGIHAEGDLAITGGKVTITNSVEGLEGATITVAGGASSVTSSDDGLNATTGVSTGGGGGGPGGGGMGDDGSVLTISGGTLIVNADGDGLDSNGSLSITGGTTVVSGPTMDGNGAIDANGEITATGGTLLAAGSAGMAVAPGSASTVGWVSVPVNLAAGQTVSIATGSTVLGSYTAVKPVASVILVDADITSGTTYDVYVGGSRHGTAVGNYSAGGNVSGADKVSTVTAGQHTGGGFGPGGRP